MASSTPTSPTSPTENRRRGTSVSSVAQSVVSATERVLDSDLPRGFIAATAQATSSVPTIAEIRRGSTVSRNVPRRERSSSGRATGQKAGLTPFPPLEEEYSRRSTKDETKADSQVVDLNEGEGVLEVESDARPKGEDIRTIEPPKRVYTSGYIPPPKLPWTTATVNGLTAFGKWVATPFGFLVTLYGLNVVAWGGMLFLLLCNASPAMCRFEKDGVRFNDCGNIDSPRRIWIEIDSQILNALFCVTGFGLVPWRFRDAYYLLRFRLTSERKEGVEKKIFWLRKLAGHYRTWFRLPGSDSLDQLSPEAYLRSLSNVQNADSESTSGDIRIPLPVKKAPDAPISGVRAPPTSLWKVDWFVWCQVWNTFFQACLCGFMWGMNRYNRPSWSTGLFVALACGIAGAGGFISFKEGRLVKKVEGIVPSVAAQEAVGVARTEQDIALALQQTRTGDGSVLQSEEKTKQTIAM